MSTTQATKVMERMRAHVPRQHQALLMLYDERSGMVRFNGGGMPRGLALALLGALQHELSCTTPATTPHHHTFPLASK